MVQNFEPDFQAIVPLQKRLEEMLYWKKAELIKQMMKEHPQVIHMLHGPAYNTSLHLVAATGMGELIEPMLKAGQNINALNRNIDTPLTAAIQLRREEVVSLLIKHQAETGPVCNQENKCSKDIRGLLKEYMPEYPLHELEQNKLPEKTGSQEP